MSELPPKTVQLRADELFRMYPDLAARVTHLRTIFQNPEAITRENVDLWIEDVRSTLRDFMTLNELAAEYLRKALKLPPQE